MQVDAQCHQLATVVGRTQLTTLATFRGEIFKSPVCNSVPEETITLHLEICSIPITHNVGSAAADGLHAKTA